MIEPLVSIIIPLYNKEKSISSTLHAVLAQSYNNLEIIVIDDGSTDKSARLVSEFKDDRLNYHYQKNQGVSAARNNGVKKSHGDLIFFLDADDYIIPDCIRILTVPFFKDPDLGICCSSFECTQREEGIHTDSKKQIDGRIIKNNYKSLFYQNLKIRAGNCLIRRQIVIDNPFDETLTRFEDMKAILEWIRYAKIFQMEIIIMSYRKDYSALSLPRNNHLTDYTFNLSFSGLPFWGKCQLGKLIYLGWYSYPSQRKFLIVKYRFNFIWGLISRVLMIISRIWKNV